MVKQRQPFISQRFTLQIDWWFPFFIFSPSMLLFILYPLWFLDSSFNWVHFVVVFSLASLNFIYGYIRMFLSFIIVEKDGIMFDYFFIRWKVKMKRLIAIQKTYRFTPIGSMSLEQIALITSERIVYVNMVNDYASFKQMFLVD